MWHVDPVGNGVRCRFYYLGYGVVNMDDSLRYNSASPNVQNSIRQMILLNMCWRIWYPVLNSEIIGFEHPIFRFDNC